MGLGGLYWTSPLGRVPKVACFGEESFNFVTDGEYNWVKSTICCNRVIPPSQHFQGRIEMVYGDHC